MKISKKTLVLLMTVGVLSLVGCSNTNNNNEDTLSQENNTVDTISEESVETEPQRITEEEAIKVVKDGLKSIEPNAKLRVKAFDENGINGSYLVEYDVPFATDVTYMVDSINKDITVDYGHTQCSISERESDINNAKKEEPLSYEEAIKLFKERMNYMAEMEAPVLSANQLDNLELASDDMYYLGLNYAWILRYPMEEKHKDTGFGITYDNALDKSDKYGYVYIDPYKKLYTTYIFAEEWQGLYEAQ